MKTYEWMAGPRGNAHLCEKSATGGGTPLCGAVLRDATPAGAERSKCGRCCGMESVVKKYQATMKADAETKEK